MPKSVPVAIISHTHWDREWYRTFQDYRLQLVDVLDELLDLLAARPEFRSFLLDGQTVLLEDYLELRPERADEIRRLVIDGRLEIGPWYVQPDEFLVAGEALIRNLELGRLTAARFGQTCQAGWLPDTFGHIAQLPQVLCNFGIDTVIFARGVGSQPVQAGGVFWLEAPSGHRVRAIHQLGGYVNGGNLGYPSFWGRVGPGEADPALAAKQVERLLALAQPAGCDVPVAVWNGADHTPAQVTLPEIIAYLRSVFPDRSITHSALHEYINAVRYSGGAWPTVQGELRGSRFQPILSGVLTTRMPLKQANARVESGLLRYAEPLAALAWLEGFPYPSQALWEAWRAVLQNQCHDSICGCHIDAVSEQIMARYRQAEDLANVLIARAARRLDASAGASLCETDTYPLLAVNTLSQPRDDVVDLLVRLPTFNPPYCLVDEEGAGAAVQVISHCVRAYEWLAANVSVDEFLSVAPMWQASLADIDGLALFNWAIEEQGEELDVTLWLGERCWESRRAFDSLLAEAARWPVETRIQVAAFYHEVELALPVHASGLGYVPYAMRESDRALMPDDPVLASPDGLENSLLRVQVDRMGAISLTHKSTARTYGPVGLLEDKADAGDAYDYSPLTGDRSCAELAGEPGVELVETGPLQAALRIAAHYRIPAGLAKDRRKRLSQTETLPVLTTLRLRSGSPVLEVTVDLDNRARDHRVRLLFPTGVRCKEIYAGGQFGVVVRAIAAPEGKNWIQPPSNLRPHSNWFGVVDGGVGLAVLTDGFAEHEPLVDSGSVTLALTVLRCVGGLSRGDLTTRKGHAGPAVETPSAQCLGRHTFRYGVLPLSAEQLDGVSGIAETFSARPYVMPRSSARGLPAGRNPFLTLSPVSLVLSTLKVSEDGKRLVVRFYNPTDATLQASVTFGDAVASVHTADASEQALQELEVGELRRQATLRVGPAEIVTLLVTPLRGAL